MDNIINLSESEDDNDFNVEEQVLINLLQTNQQQAQNNQNLEAIMRPLIPDNHRHLSCTPKHEFDHEGALCCIRCNYMGLPNNPLTPIFVGKDFEMMFRLTKKHVEKILQDIGNSAISSFYLNTIDATGKQGSSMEARVLLPLKTFAYGVPPHTFSDYFQMSKDFSKEC